MYPLAPFLGTAVVLSNRGMKVSCPRGPTLSLVPVDMATAPVRDHLRSLEHLSSAYQYEEFSENTKPTDKPHTKLDVFGGKKNAGTQSPTHRFTGNMLKGPLGRVDPQGSEGREVE